MFALIVTIISIALVVALALAVLYYGGKTSQKASTRAIANTLINQGAQINAAGTIAIAQGSGWPRAAPFFTQPFLNAMPVPPKSAYVSGIEPPSANDWQYYRADLSTRHFGLRDKIGREVCMAVNQEMGVIGIPAAWDGKTLIQCFGPGTGDTPAYTFFYAPVGATPKEKSAALEQSLSDGGTTTPGYPRLCPTGETITEGTCNAGTGQGGGNTGNGDGNGGGNNNGGGTGGGGTGEVIPTPAECAAAPSNPACDASKFPALRISNSFGTGRVTFTAISSCAEAGGEICLPSFQSKYRSWENYLPGGTRRDIQDMFQTDPNKAVMTTAEGFSISDGSRTYTISRSESRGMLYGAKLEVRELVTGSELDCASAQAQAGAKGAFFAFQQCSRIVAGANNTWLFIGSGNYDISDARQLNPTWTFTPTSSPEYGIYVLATPTGATPLSVAQVVTMIDEKVPLHVSEGRIDNWPMASLEPWNGNGSM